MIKLNPEQKFRIAKLPSIGYDGPKEGLDNFLRAFPDKKQIFDSIVVQVDTKARTKKFDTGGLATEDQIQKIGVEELGRAFKSGPGGGLEFYKDYTPTQVRAMVSGSEEGKAFKATQPTIPTTTPPKAPEKPKADTAAVAKIGTPTAAQDIKFDKITDVTKLTTPESITATQADVPTTQDAVKTTTTDTAAATAKALEDLKPATGTVSDKALAKAETIDPRETAVKDVEAAQLDTARKVEDAPTRTLKQEEIITGPTVDTARVDTELAKTQAAQMDLTPEATIQGQLTKLYQDFDVKDPPSWADGAVRKAMSTLSARGLGASSLAGQAVVQAVMESALPIAQADAQAAFNLGIQNLSNRQQTVILSAQQRAQFLGQEFDQAFQTRVTNAARVSEIANLQFNADQQVALENAKLAQTTDLANLTNKQAVVMANAAQIANLETTNLNNRQQTAVQNAQAFLQVDMANLSNQQQTNIFKAQSTIQSLFTDAAAQNAAAQFNASSKNQVNQFYDSLTTQVQQFNATQKNAIDQFNIQQSTAVEQFNAQQQNAVDQFNASNGLVVSQANAEWRRNIATIDTAAQNQVNQFNAQSALALTTREYEGKWQEYKDILAFAHETGENALDRESQHFIALLNKQAAIESAKFAMTSELYQAGGSLAAAIASGSNLFGKGGVVRNVVEGIKELASDDVDTKYNLTDDDFSLIGDDDTISLSDDRSFDDVDLDVDLFDDVDLDVDLSDFSLGDLYEPEDEITLGN